MAVVVEVIIPGLTRDAYDALRNSVDCHGLDTWESEAAFASFGETRLAPALAELGIAAVPVPTFHEPHEVFVPAAVQIT